MASDYNNWMSKTVEIEAMEWRRQISPKSDAEGHYHTESIVIIFQVRILIDIIESFCFCRHSE